MTHTHLQEFTVTPTWCCDLPVTHLRHAGGSNVRRAACVTECSVCLLQVGQHGYEDLPSQDVSPVEVLHSSLGVLWGPEAHPRVGRGLVELIVPSDDVFWPQLRKVTEEVEDIFGGGAVRNITEGDDTPWLAKLLWRDSCAHNLHASGGGVHYGVPQQGNRAPHPVKAGVRWSSHSRHSHGHPGHEGPEGSWSTRELSHHATTVGELAHHARRCEALKLVWSDTHGGSHLLRPHQSCCWLFPTALRASSIRGKITYTWRVPLLSASQKWKRSGTSPSSLKKSRMLASVVSFGTPFITTESVRRSAPIGWCFGSSTIFSGFFSSTFFLSFPTWPLLGEESLFLFAAAMASGGHISTTRLPLSPELLSMVTAWWAASDVLSFTKHLPFSCSMMISCTLYWPKNWTISASVHPEGMPDTHTQVLSVQAVLSDPG
ncbi:hypothetical protein E2C01_019084 [Portunus trituberculatus]|uniref:Uncharacterized protein n=1 Tax=Portunus trituberculatus TaxID=210409 RepID=A0A5B7DWQ9_PORTR|nr:hypothetical protein [Portunus trituberculatus]